MLASLHSRKSDEFALAQGFGRVRMMSGRVFDDRIELPAAAPIPLPTREQPEYDANQLTSGAPTNAGAPPQSFPQSQLVHLHLASQVDFFDPDRIGYVVDRDHVAGFSPHRFTKMPEQEPSTGAIPAWQIVRLELVSLLKHEVPVAYLSKNLPQMDVLRDAPTRMLDDFERSSLERIRADEDVVIDEAPDRIKMLGSLRAAKDCTKCHSVQRGELLGALTYELMPARRSPSKPARPADIN